MENVELIAETVSRVAFPFVPSVIRAMVPRDYVGVYVLFDEERPVYVGRSDTCVHNRLSAHNLLGKASHFVWEPRRTPFHAFCMEAWWYHHLEGSKGNLNAIHPAKPEGCQRSCPFCCPKLEESLHRALGLTV